MPTEQYPVFSNSRPFGWRASSALVMAVFVFAGAQSECANTNVPGTPGTPAGTGGKIIVWGKTDSGQNAVASPNSGYKAIGCGEFHGMGIRTDGKAEGWGSNSSGQARPNLADNNNFTAVTGGHDHSLGLKADGTVLVLQR